MSVTLVMPEEELPMTDPLDIRAELEHQLDLIIEGGNCGLEPTSVVDLAMDAPTVIRVGKGSVAAFE